MLGVDIHASNVQQACSKYAQLKNLRFQVMARGGAIPLLDSQPYHMIFATFVLETIPAFNEVSALCRNMIDALRPGGELYLLRLHPNSLCFGDDFHEYQLPKRANWQHGDPLLVNLINSSGSITIHDFFWRPECIAETVESLGCQYHSVALTHDASVEGVAQRLVQLVDRAGLSLDMPEWNVPLYQLVRIRK